jgi:Protein of unknown function (DUF3551)
MKLWLSAFVVGVAAAACGSPAQAQNYPWCAQYTGSMGGSMNCGFTSFDQCMATVRGMGGFCVTNTLYQPPGGGAPATRHRAPKHHAP